MIVGLTFYIEYDESSKSYWRTNGRLFRLRSNCRRYRWRWLDDLIVGAPMYTVPDNPEMTIELEEFTLSIRVMVWKNSANSTQGNEAS